MKICIISPLFDPWLVGGAEKYITNLANNLAVDNAVTVITTRGPTRRQTPAGANPKVVELPPNNVMSLHDILTKSSRVGAPVKALWHLLDTWNIATYLQVRRILKEERPDIVHTNGIKGLSASIFAAIKNSKIPHVHTIHDYELISRWSSLFRRGASISAFTRFDRAYISMMKYFSSGIDDVISPSRFVLDFHTNLGFFPDAKKNVISNGMKLSRSAQPKRQLNKSFLYVGQVEMHKGVQIAVQAFKMLDDRDAALHVVGEGDYLDEIRALAASDRRIVIHGYVKERSELDALYETCSFLVFPSIWLENFPLVINEAMNRGLPVIASNIGGVPELVKHGYNGFLFDPGQTQSLFNVLSQVLAGQCDLRELSANAIASSLKDPIEKQNEEVLRIYMNRVNKTSKILGNSDHNVLETN